MKQLLVSLYLFIIINSLQNISQNFEKNFTLTVVYPWDQIKSHQQMHLRGESKCQNLNWNKGLLMKKSNLNEFEIQINNCQQQNIEFKVLLDDIDWQVGANNLIDLQIGTKYTIYPYFKYVEGDLTILKNFYSSFFQNSRDVIVYTPPGYTENYLKYYQNVIIMTDGQNLFLPETSFLGQCWYIQDTLNSKILNGSMQEVIVVGIYNTADRMEEYTYIQDPEYGGGYADEFLDFVENNVMPKILSDFRIDTKKFGMIGSSLGGLLSCFSGISRGNLYNKVGCMSSSFWWDDENFVNKFLPQHKTQIKKDLKIYLDCGTDEEALEESIRVENYLKNLPQFELGKNLFYYVDIGGQHSEYYWGKRFSHPMEKLYPIEPLLPQNN